MKQADTDVKSLLFSTCCLCYTVKGDFISSLWTNLTKYAWIKKNSLEISLLANSAAHTLKIMFNNKHYDLGVKTQVKYMDFSFNEIICMINNSL